ncbi:DUF397 domain-containing protein [Streptomyces sp. VRA16 Mangrove soil]|uniref:DUF397 domain-containing protein n=1 Tax=Streptomyces sp. VRA16 Mangrove soil TaxID=2817434 RepID=UPI001A9FF108|nr:DUF397 domain-containing protein [Streptomyces sp. VRA16 Mangrove soil]MBO1330969.1 DUF397 domain-containing protein [Streptomyces sp. VRA16 Mangrove soil]
MNSERGTTSSAGLNWVKSSYSGSDGGNCIEVAVTSGSVRVRDSKDTGLPGLRVADASWSAFVTYARRG